MRLITVIVCLLLAYTSTWAHSEAPTKTSYAESGVFNVGGEGRWDYLSVDAAGKRLFVTRSNHVLVLDETSGKTLADISGQKGNHGVAIVPELNRGFITDGGDSAVVVFDLKTYAVLGKVKAAEDADGIIYDATSKNVLVSCGDSAALAVFSPDVDLAKDPMADLIPLGGKSEFLAADGQGKVYVNLEEKSAVAVVDLKAKKILNTWPVAPGGIAVGMAIDAAHHHLFIGCRSPQKMIVMSSDDGKFLADLPIGAGVDFTVFDDGAALASCGDGTLTVVRETSPGKFEAVQSVKTRPGARTMGVDSASHQVFLPTAEMMPVEAGQRRAAPKADTFMVVVVSRSGG